jgi:hypothetical protein
MSGLQIQERMTHYIAGGRPKGALKQILTLETDREPGSAVA